MGAAPAGPLDDQQVVAAVRTALGSDPFPDPKVRAAVNSFLQETHTNEGLARLVENPAFETSAEASGGFTPPKWLFDPSVQLGKDNGHQVGGFTFEKSKDGIGKMSMKVSFNPDEKTITATYAIGPQVKVGNENRLLQKVVAIKFQYRDNEAYLHAMGIDARTLPGGAATLRMMEILHLKSAETSTLPPETSAIDAAAHAAQRDVLPQIFQSALDFKNVTCGTGYTVTLENGMEAGKGEVAAKRSMTILTQERLEPGQKQGEGVKFAEVAVSVGVGANANYKLSKVAGDVSVGVTYSTDPEKKGATVGPERRKLAEELRAGRLADAGALAFQTLAQITQSSQVSSLVEHTVSKIYQRQDNKATLDGLGAANAALAELLRTTQQRIGPLPAEPLVEAVGSAVRAVTPQQTVVPLPMPPPRVVVARAKMSLASYQAHLEQAQVFQAAATTEFAKARNEPDPVRREKHFQKVLDLQDKRDGLTTTLALEFKAASRSAASAVAGSTPSEDSHVNSAHFKSPTFELLKQMAPSSAVAARAFDGAADRAYQEVNKGVGTRFFSLPPASGTQKEPGGIKFSGARAQELAATLDVTSIAFDPVRGRIVLVGAKQTEQTFDLDVFADVLRLAAEEYEPFFSLDSSEPGDWDASLGLIINALAKKYHPEEVARRVRELSPTGIPHGGRIYYYTTVEALDPELAAQANRGKDLTVKLVYSPDWLRYSKVGAILFDGDLAIKAVASGFHDRGGAIEPAFVWQLPDFDPVWLQRGDESAGRANFELAHAKILEGGTRLDLVDVHPGLYVTGRRSGTNQDLAPSGHDRAISQHFDQHWREYVTQVPEIGRLEMVFRAYVAARFLIERHPGLAARIQSMPREVPPEQPPLRMVMPTVIRVAFEGDKPVPMVAGDEGLYNLSLGYGGGVKFGVEPQGTEKSRVEVQTVSVDPSDWAQGLLAAAAYGDEGYSESIGGGTAVVLYFDSPTLGGMWHLRVVAAVGLLVVFSVGAALLLRQFDWQKLSSVVTCRHCTRIHRRIGQGGLLASAIAAGAMMYLSLLPLVGAYDGRWSLPQIIAAAVILVAVMLSFVMMGLLVRAASAAARIAAPRSCGPTTAMLSGAQLAGVAFAAFLFHRGFSGAAMGSNLARLLGPAVVERVFARLGGIEPMAIASLVAAAGSVLALLMRWAAPYVFDSRPLPMYRVSGHTHSLAHS